MGSEGTTCFLQYFNLWQDSDEIKHIAFKLGALAASLLEVPRVRLYGDSVFMKRTGDEGTGWHTDMEHVPLDTDAFLTFWIPLQEVKDVAQGGSPLLFVSGSHTWSEEASPANVREVRCLQSHGLLRPGDVTVHHGRMLHAAPELEGCFDPRSALALSYFADGAARVPLPYEDEDDDEERESYQAWIDDIPIGEVARHRLLPEVYAATEEKLRALLLSHGDDKQSIPHGDDWQLHSKAAHSLQLTEHGSWRFMMYHSLLLQVWDCLCEAELLWRTMRASQQGELGLHHPAVLENARIHARLLRLQGNYDKSEALFREVTAACHESLGPLHRTTLVSNSGLGLLLRAQGRNEEAEVLLQETLEGLRAILGEEHSLTREVVADLDLLAQGNHEASGHRIANTSDDI